MTYESIIVQKGFCTIKPIIPIFDTAGKLLLSKRVRENEVESTINIQSLSEGIYFTSFSVNGQKRFTQKLVKIKPN